MKVSKANTVSVEQLLAESLHHPVQAFVSIRGKQIRASLVQVSYAAAGGTAEHPFIPFPAEILEAIEWLHAGSLIIDDIQDESTCRRGRPTMHRDIGIPLAINAGNYMYFRALEFLTDTNLPEPMQHRILGEFIRAARSCHEGQAIDLAARLDRLKPSDWLDIVQAVAVQKTGKLVELAMRSGAIVSQATRGLEDGLGRFGGQVGVALQMRNDLDELANVVALHESDSPLLRTDDLRHCRITWPWAWLTSMCSISVCQRLVRDLREAIDQANNQRLGQVAAELLARIHVTGEREIKRCLDDSLCLLGEHVVEHETLGSLRECLRLIERGSGCHIELGAP